MRVWKRSGADPKEDDSVASLTPIHVVGKGKHAPDPPPVFPPKSTAQLLSSLPRGGAFPPQKRKPNGRPSPGGVVRGPRQGCEYYVLPYSYCFFSRLRQDRNRTNGLLSSPLSVGRGAFRGRRIIEPPRTERPPRIERGGQTQQYGRARRHMTHFLATGLVRARTCFSITKMTFKGETRIYSEHGTWHHSVILALAMCLMATGARSLARSPA